MSKIQERVLLRKIKKTQKKKTAKLRQDQEVQKVQKKAQKQVKRVASEEEDEQLSDDKITRDVEEVVEDEDEEQDEEEDVIERPLKRLKKGENEENGVEKEEEKKGEEVEAMIPSIPREVLSENRFEDFKDKISEQTLRAIRGMGFSQMTEIQAKTIPHLLEGRDVVGAAKTGSGKTLAFLVPAIELMNKLKFMPRNGCGVLIISPTRELSMQTFGVLKDLMEYHNQTYGLVMGGTNRQSEAVKLSKGVNVVVATPGRLLDHLQNTKQFLFKNLQCLVIDEADRILDIGFEEEIKEIIRILPKQRQTMLFSATLTKKTEDLISVAIKNEPLYIGIDETREKATVEGLEQGYVIASSDKRFLLLFTFLKKNRKKKVMVFFSSCMSVKFHHELLNYIDLPVMCIHGKQKQTKRTTTFFQFCSADSGILLCTDVAARGLDIPQVDWIVQFDPPDDPKEYIHRVGRTARGEGGRGHALLILRPEELGFLRYLKEAKVPLQEFDFSWNKVANIQPQLEKLMAKNYFLNLSAKEAYKAYVRAYDSHSLKHIFNVTTLDLVSVAKSFGFAVPPFVDMPVTGSNKPSKGQYNKRGKPGGSYSGSGPSSYSKKRTEKSLIYKAVPVSKDKDKRQFSR